MGGTRIAFLSIFIGLAACGGASDDANAPGHEQNGSGDETVPGVTTSRVRYAADRTHSPITTSIADNIRAIASRGVDRNDDMFMKVGDSITESFAVMSCFAGGTVDLAGRDALQGTLDFYRAANVSGASNCAEEWCQGATTAFNRASYAALGGATADYPLTGTPAPLTREDDAIKPRVALVEYGTNDATLILTASDAATGFTAFHGHMQALVDALIQRGVVPVLYTIPPYIESRNGYRNVPTMNAIIRMIAQSRAIPLIDFGRELLPLPDHGLWDGVHPRVELGGCVFTEAGLQYGYNVRNLLSLEALARVKNVLDGGQAPDTASAFPGSGTEVAPFAVAALPFVDAADGRTVYRLSISASARVRFLALTRSGTAAIAVESGGVSLGSADTVLHATLAAGTYDVTVSGAAFALAIVSCDVDDVTCQ